MPIYAEYNDQNIVFAVTESDQAPNGHFIYPIALMLLAG
jgi:hypothetical protein